MYHLLRVRGSKRANLLVLGASGGVANAFLHHLSHHRSFFNKVILLDRNKKVLDDPYIDHRALDYIFLHKEISLPKREEEYLSILREHKITMVLDITDECTIPLLEATNKAGAHYINTAMNDNTRTVSDLIFDVYARKESFNGAAHILCTGMNPGVVNMLVRCGIEKFGVPSEVIHFEYDTSVVSSKWRPMMTWSVHEFLVECVRDPAGIMLGRGNVKQLYPNALEHKKSLKPLLSPILKIDRYPDGFEVLHEENVSIAQKYNIPSKFIYAVNMHTMDMLERVYKKRHGKVEHEDLILGDNTNEILDGSDSIGVLLEYPNRRVYYFNSMPNNAIIGTNATYTQVVIGIFSAIFTLLFDKLEPGAHFVEDLYHTHFRYYMFDNMRIQEFIFKKEDGQLKIERYVPEIKIKRRNRFEHIYM